MAKKDIAAIATMSFFVFGGVSTVAVHADTTSGNSTAATVNSTSDTKSAGSSAATVASSAASTTSSESTDTDKASSVASTTSSESTDADKASSAASTTSSKSTDADKASSVASTTSSESTDADKASSAASTTSSKSTDADKASSVASTTSSVNTGAASKKTSLYATSTDNSKKIKSSLVSNHLKDNLENVALSSNSVQPATSISDDTYLKNLGIDINDLNTNSVLKLASLFHIFANQASLSADTNGNLAVKILNGSNDFGTRGDSYNLTSGDIYYIQQLAKDLQSNAFRNKTFNHVVLGKNVNVSIENNKVLINGITMDNLKPEDVYQDTTGQTYIDFSDVFQQLISSSTSYTSTTQSKGVISNYSDMNNRYIDVSGVAAGTQIIYVNVPFEYLSDPQPITIKGISNSLTGPTIVINVTGIPDGNQNISTQVQFNYIDGTNALPNSEGHTEPNHVLWNLGTGGQTFNFSSGRFMGSILAPNATINAGVNIDGNIVANVVNITGGESHRWDIHPQPTQPTQPTQTSESQTVNETIHYVYKNGDKAADDYQATPLNFTRTVTTDKVTGKKTYGSWSADQSFPAVTSPAIKGYTPDQAQIDTITGITADSADIEKTVTYVANKEAAKVTYIDDTTGKTLSSQDLSGDYGTTDSYRTADSIKGYEDQGYQLVSDNYPTNGVVYNQDGTVQSFEVHLTHGTTPVGPNNPQTPGEPINPDNPDGPKWPEGTDKSSLTQTVIRTVNYLDKQTGKVVAKQVTEQVTYNRTAIVDKVTGQIIGYSTTGAGTVDQTDGDKAWTAVDNKSDWDSVTSPDLSSKGYLAPDLTTVAQQTVTPGDKDVTVNVYYDHDVVPVNPTNPQTPGTPINPDDPDSPKWPAGTDKNSLTTDVHQTIHYQYGDGSQAAPDKTDSTTFDHQVEIDKVTGEIVKDDGWTAENGKTSFDSKNSPVIPGYTASKPASDSVDGLTQDSKDNVQTIVYAKNPVAGGNVTAKYVDENGNPIADDVIASGNVGDPYSTTQKDVPGYTFKEVQGNPTRSFTDQDQTVTYVYTKNPETDNNGGTEPNQPGKPGNGTDTGNPSSNQPGNPSQPSNATNNGVINTSTNTGYKVNNGAVNSPELPQTGENNSQSQTMSFIGILLAMFGSSLGFLGIKKRRND